MTERSARAVRIPEPGRLEVVPVEVQAPEAGEALVRVAWAGICGSDRDLLEGTRPAPFVRYPVVPGHEWSGTVESVGAGVDTGLVGRPVVGEGFRSCGVCPPCRRGETTLCEAAYDETGFTAPGAWCDYLTIPARLLHVLPDDADLRAAALLEPAACIAGAALAAHVVPGDRVAVVGAGALGLLGVQLLAAAGAAEVVAVDPNCSRASLALRCGAASLHSPDKAEELAGSFDVVLEAAGAPGAARLAIRLARRGGRVVLTGIPVDESDSIGVQELVTAAVQLKAVFGAPSAAWVHAVRAFAAGVLDPGPLVGRTFALEDVESAFAALDSPDREDVKVLLQP
jgi:2-desacetyl-2-hydroxyethyl bacteriochlorophyllide A dehydrogenase